MPSASLLPLLLLVAAGVVVLLLIVGQPAWRRRRRDRIARQPFPAAWRRILRRRVPQAGRLPPPLQRQLQGLIQVFVAEKAFIGCQGLRITDEMRVTIAAQACLLLLNRSHDFFGGLRQVLVYPCAFVVQRVHTGPGGVLQDRRQALSGESWSQGQVILSWEDVLHGAADPGDGRNVVLHEFAHQLDQAEGSANGAPPLGSRQRHARWATVMNAEFQRLHRQLQWGEPTLLGEYAATDPAEFFAVATEVFFEQPALLAQESPALYDELRSYYHARGSTW